MTAATEKVPNYVGFANLPNQVFRKAVKRGFQFTLMVVGQSGLGKSTLVNSLFLTDLYQDAAYPNPAMRIPKTTEIRSSTMHMMENGVHLELTIVDTPGFGDLVDNSACWKPIMDHIDSKYDEYLNAESRVTRGAQLDDHRVHCCLYFITPSGHGLKQLDVAFMKQLHEKVNIVPVIAKADTFTPEECERFKATVMQEIRNYGIKIYQFPDAEDDEDETQANRKLKERIPFAIVGSNSVVEASSKKVRGRVYPWGVAEVDSLDHCDFVVLRNMLIRTHMQDLKDVTNNVHYENFRCKKLAGVVGPMAGDPKVVSNAPSRDPLAQFEMEKREHTMKMKKMEQEMEEVFEMKVVEKQQKLKDIEQDLNRRKETMKRQLEQQSRDLNERRRQFEDDKRLFEKEYQEWMEKMESQSSSQQDLKAGGKSGKKGHRK